MRRMCLGRQEVWYLMHKLKYAKQFMNPELGNGGFRRLYILRRRITLTHRIFLRTTLQLIIAVRRETQKSPNDQKKKRKKTIRFRSEEYRMNDIIT